MSLFHTYVFSVMSHGLLHSSCVTFIMYHVEVGHCTIALHRRTKKQWIQSIQRLLWARLSAQCKEVIKVDSQRVS